MRLNKRQFVKGAAATALVAGFARFEGCKSPTHIVVYNDWFPEAHAFATGLSKHGARALPVQGDAGILWYQTLRGLLAQGPVRMAGMTTHTDLLILETLAREHGLRVRERAGTPNTRLVSWVLI